MPLQSQNGVVRILPALSKAWQQGSGLLKNVQIKSLDGALLTLVYDEKKVGLQTEKGMSYSFNGELKTIN